MKKFSVLTSVMFGFVADSLQAGTEVYKQVAPPPPPELYGLGFYGAIDAGANVFQNRGGDRTFSDDNPNSPFFGDTLTVSPKNDGGFFGGIKLGYVFGTGVFRPTIEGDFFYKGFEGGAPAGGRVIQTSPGRLLPAQITIGLPSSARLSNTSSSSIQAPNSILMKIAIWGST